MASSRDVTLREARARYFQANGIDDDALPPHDLHHVATGFDTTLVGEAEIGAWELASGCRHYPPGSSSTRPEHQGIRIVGVMHRKSGDERVDFFLSYELGPEEPRNVESGKCSELVWASVSKPPNDTIPYVRAGLESFARGEWFQEFGWTPGGD
jgi:hypothetical protein